MGCGAALIDTSLDEYRCNETARVILSRFVGAEPTENFDVKQAIKLVLSNDSSRFRSNSESWLAIHRHDMKPLAVHAIPAAGDDDSYKKTLVIFTDLNENFRPNDTVLQKMFNLTPSELHIINQICHGKTPSEIAKDKGITLWTIRSQLASIFSKTKTRRQTELVALAIKTSVLP
jgi:DNA-binding CsgD family transcriptional regulator